MTAQRKLEEARLSMTAEANLSLIKKGVSIDTEPIERVVELLKQQENKYYGALFGESSVEASDDRVRMYNNVCDIFNQMKAAAGVCTDPWNPLMTLCMSCIQQAKQ